MVFLKRLLIVGPILLIFSPWIIFLILSFIITEHPTTYALCGWMFISPIWAGCIGVFFYWEGKAIAVIDTANNVISTVQDNKHHAVNAFNFVKSKMNKE